mmetsp:Transcript_17490/g.55332  ORF Transcript_17490/g.55332 Transcript_17490/m.55332 type:complete len:221 (-) Transcript_17490:2-664(-)
MAALGRFIFRRSSPRLASSMAPGLPTMIASVSFWRAASLFPSSIASAASPLNLFCLSSSSSASCFSIAAASGNAGGSTSSAVMASGSSESSPSSSSGSLGALTQRSSIPLSARPSASDNLRTSSSASAPSAIFSVCQEWCAATSMAIRCFSMLIVACGSICTRTVSPFTHRFLWAGVTVLPRSSSTMRTLMFHWVSDMAHRLRFTYTAGTSAWAALAKMA